MVLSFSGQLLVAVSGTGDKGHQYTRLEFSPINGSSFTVFANGHVDLAQYLRKEMDWSLGVSIGRNGRLNVEKVAGVPTKSK